MQLSGKVVLITGAKGGLGAYVTPCVSGCRRTGGRCVSVHQRRGLSPSASSRACPSELTSAAQAQALAGAVLQTYGRIDAAVHLLGGYKAGRSMADSEDASFDGMLDLNLRSLFHLVRAVLPGMRAECGGRVLAIGSRAAMDPQAMSGAHSAAKAALVSLMRAAAKENRHAGITAIVILPGAMDTPANRAAIPDADPGQWVRPEQVANLLV